MFERFTDRARKVMVLANMEAQQFGHDYIGTEHILLGLLKEGSGVAANVLKNLGIESRVARREVEKLIKADTGPVTTGKLPQTPRTKRVIEYAIQISDELGHNYVGTEHLLLGLLREPDGIAAQVLTGLGVSSERAREETMNLLGGDVPRRWPSSPRPADVKHDFTDDVPREVGHPAIVGCYRLLLSTWDKVQLHYEYKRDYDSAADAEFQGVVLRDQMRRLVNWLANNPDVDLDNQ